MTQTIKTAHYFGKGKNKFVIISNSFAPVGEKIAVAGKFEAERIAAERGAKPWNF